MPPRDHLLAETNLARLREYAPNVAVLPWGATEAHNFHLPYGTDTLQAAALAERAAGIAVGRGARPVVLPAVPFGNDQQQLDQVCTISITTPTAAGLLRDVARSLLAQSIDRLVVLNCHGGNQFQPLVRDLEAELPILVVVINFWELIPEVRQRLFDAPGDHADETETSLLLHLRPDLVELGQAGPGDRKPFAIKSLSQPGVWTPRPWSKCHPDTGSGDPRAATAEKGEAYFAALCEAISEVLVDLSAAQRGDLPYI